MTYFSLRKHDTEPAPDDVLDEETVEEEADGDEAAPTPSGLGPALWAGASGPGRWLHARGRADAAWLLYVGSVWAVGFYGGWVAVGVITTWVAVVLAFMPRETLERVAARMEGWGEARGAALDEAVTSTEPEAGGDAPVDPHAVLVGWLDDLTRGRSGIHLDELHQALTRHPQLSDLKRPEMRAWLDRHHITVDRTIRVGAVAGRSGVSRATVEALLVALPPLLESGGTKRPLHASGLHDSPLESGVERGGERAV